MNLASALGGTTLEWLGSVCGIVGTLMLASNTSWSKWAWLIWCASSASVASITYSHGLYGVFVQQLVYTGFNIWGVWRWLLLPRWRLAAWR